MTVPPIFRTLAILFLLFALPGPGVAQEKGYLGINIQNLEVADAQALGWEEPRAAKVVGVKEGYPAAGAGVLAGDIIVSLDGVEIDKAESLAAALAQKPPGTEVSLRLLRAGKEKRIKATLAPRPVELDQGAQGAKCSKYMPSIGKSVEVPCGPGG